MEVAHAAGIEGARGVGGAVVVIDVIRAFTVAAWAFAQGAVECRLADTVPEAVALAAQIPGSVLSAEEDGLPVPGIPISNSPSMVRALDLRGRVLVMRSSAGTRGVVASDSAELVLGAGLVNATASARYLRRLQPPRVTLLSTGALDGHPEDRACADFLEALLLERRPRPLDQLLAPLKVTGRYRRLLQGGQAGFPPADLELCLALDAFDFAMRAAGGRLFRVDPDAG
ncbi:MAG TPA: 2-phosphosulfolactate phosphatase [Candidatus Dormibacteraeota bacterium]